MLPPCGFTCWFCHFPWQIMSVTEKSAKNYLTKIFPSAPDPRLWSQDAWQSLQAQQGPSPHIWDCKEEKRPKRTHSNSLSCNSAPLNPERCSSEAGKSPVSVSEAGLQELRALAHNHCLWTRNISVFSNVMVPLAKEMEAYLHGTSPKPAE